MENMRESVGHVKVREWQDRQSRSKLTEDKKTVFGLNAQLKRNAVLVGNTTHSGHMET